MKVHIVFALLFSFAFGAILQNGQLRDNPYPGQAALVSVAADSAWKSYTPNASELSYKGRWDSKYISWWSAPGLKFGFLGQDVAISFGNYTTPGGMQSPSLLIDRSFPNILQSACRLPIRRPGLAILQRHC